jgi:hypothetical protein
LGNDKQNDLSLSFHIKSFRIINDTKKWNLRYIYVFK